jgi:hypothetical protein
VGFSSREEETDMALRVDMREGVMVALSFYLESQEVVEGEVASTLLEREGVL